MKFIFFVFFTFLILNTCLGQGTVDSLSFQSLSLEVYSDNINIDNATGFVVEKNNKYYLITNLHVVTGEDYFSHAIIDKDSRKPNWIAIWHNGQKLGSWVKFGEPLYDKNNNKRWIECEVAGKVLDLIALPLTNTPPEIKLFPLHLNEFNENVLALPGFSASIIGFPHGLASDGKFAIWKTGHIASDLDLNSNGLPMFMIDATTRPGMSGSIVVLRMSPYMQNNGTHVGIGTRFLGIYSAQSDLEELGYVIKPIALTTLWEKLP